MSKQVTLDMLLRYFWSAALGIAPVLLVSVSALDFYDVSKGEPVAPYAAQSPPNLVTVLAYGIFPCGCGSHTGWIRHNWSLPALEGVRKVFCETGWEAGGQCAAPIMGHPNFDTAMVRQD
jgi:hypothetical protein